MVMLFQLMDDVVKKKERKREDGKKNDMSGKRGDSVLTSTVREYQASKSIGLAEGRYFMR